jgi:S1-C subfamily serine protease
MILPDEPIIFMGNPLDFPYTLTTGKLGNNAFRFFKNETFIHYIAATNSGDSGGPLMSLLDFKVIGMTTMAKTDHDNITLQSGAVPFWIIQKELREVDMK